MGRARLALTGLAVAALVQGCSYRLVQDERLNPGALRGLVRRTVATRHLNLTANLPVELVGEAALRAEVLREYRESPARAKLKPYELLLKKLGLIAPGLDLEAYIVDLLAGQIAGYYDPESKTLRLVAGSTDLDGPLGLVSKLLRRDLAGEFLLGHELTHALDDQHFDLQRFTDVPGNSDAAAARKAFAEGEAMLVGMHVVLNRPMKRAAFAPGDDAEAAWDKAPAVIKRQILFEYVDGLNFAGAVYGKGGTKALDAVYGRPPRSSEEILHPAKYLAGGDAPRAVTLGADAPAFAGLTRMDEDTLGEIGVASLLEEPLGEAGAKVAAAGWGGDRFRIYQVPGRPDAVAFRWLSVWDSAAERAEFADNLALALTKRYGAAVSEGATRRWATQDGAWSVAERGEDEVSVELRP